MCIERGVTVEVYTQDLDFLRKWNGERIGFISSFARPTRVFIRVKVQDRLLDKVAVLRLFLKLFLESFARSRRDCSGSASKNSFRDDSWVIQYILRFFSLHLEISGSKCRLHGVGGEDRQVAAHLEGVRYRQGGNIVGKNEVQKSR